MSDINKSFFFYNDYSSEWKDIPSSVEFKWIRSPLETRLHTRDTT